MAVPTRSTGSRQEVFSEVPVHKTLEATIGLGLCDKPSRQANPAVLGVPSAAVVTLEFFDHRR